MKISTLLKKPSAFLPLAMSTAALATVVGYLAVNGVVREPDEGAAAHIWQMLMAGQVPIILFFAMKWLPTTTRQALVVLTLQAGAALSAMAPVFFLEL
jgi:hypothetical protein